MNFTYHNMRVRVNGHVVKAAVHISPMNHCSGNFGKVMKKPR